MPLDKNRDTKRSNLCRRLCFFKKGNIYSFAAIFNSTNLNKDHARNSLGEIIKTLIEKY